MPEGPEVRSLVDQLNRNVKNKTLKSIEIKKGRYVKHGPPKGYKKFIKELPLKVKKVNCKGKFIYWEFKNSDFSMWNTLGMSGWWVKTDQKHSNIKFTFNDSVLYFKDMRNFGTFTFCDKSNLEKKLNTLGPDILETKDEVDEFIRKVEKKRSDIMIGSVLLDQKIAAGCGNYLRSECLYIARISPFREVGNMKKEELIKIWDILRQLGWYFYDEKKGIKKGIINSKYKIRSKYKKTGPSDYKPGEGFFLVYRQDKDPLGNKVLHKKIKTRMVHYVESLQK